MPRDKFPSSGESQDKLLQQMQTFKSDDLDWRKGRSFSYIYKPTIEIESALQKAYSLFISENALNPSAFPSLRRMEGEVIEMCLDLFQAKETGVGSMTSGGTESILMALKSAKEYAKIHRPEITEPEVLFSISAHPAFNKACDYFSLKPIIVPTGNDFRADPETMASAVTPNTILMVGSAPSYPQGVVDPIAELGQLALKHNLLLHVDACVGGFVLPFLAEEQQMVFDLSTPGVTSLSADIHKYGFCCKGCSVVLYNDPELRKAQFYVYTDWPGGMYGSPTIAGTRPGGAIATAWITLKLIGKKGYQEQVDIAMKVANDLHIRLNRIPGLQVLGEPDICIFSFASDEFDIYELGDEMYLKGWLMDRQQDPACLHISVSPNHIHHIDAFEKDLLDCVARVKKISLATLNKNIQIQAAKVLQKVLPDEWYKKVQAYSLKKSGVEGKRSAALYGMIGDLKGTGNLEALVRGYLDVLMRKP